MDEIFQRITAHLHKLGIEPTFITFKPAGESTLQKAEKKIGLILPDQLRNFYLTYSNGFLFHWERKKASGFCEIPSLGRLVKICAGWKENVLWMRNKDFLQSNYPLLARQTYARMQSWIPLLAEGDRSGFCIESGSRGGPVVFHEHDWFDGGTGMNGHMIAPTFSQWIENWSGVCYSGPKNLYWPATFTQEGVAWTGQYFPHKYIVTR
jgi:hypothetical protein